MYEVQHHFSEKFLDRGKEVELPLFLPPCVFCPTTAISKTSVGEYQFTIPRWNDARYPKRNQLVI